MVWKGSERMSMEKRHTGIELLRIVAMLMIVTLHFLTYSGNLLTPGTETTVTGVLGTMLENLCIGAVNAYVFISGYYSKGNSFKTGKVLRFVCQVWFYSMLPLVCMALGCGIGVEEGIYGILPYVFPFGTEHYWFATSFLVLMLLMPFLNQAVEALPQRTFRTALLFMLILLSGIKSVLPVSFATDRYGYDTVWFIFVYLLAAYAARYDTQGIFRWIREKRSNAALVFCLSAAVGMAIQFTMKDLGTLLPGLKGTSEYYFTVPYHYNTLTVLSAAVGLFYLFQSFTFKEGRTAGVIRLLGSLSFGIYLLHEHMDIRDQWYEVLRKTVNPHGMTGIGAFVKEWLFCVFMVSVAGLCVDCVRAKLFTAVERGVRKLLKR